VSERKTGTVFYGILVRDEGCAVQDWYNGLGDNAQLEIANLVDHLSGLAFGLWRRPEFDPLEGEGGISELRPRNIRTEDGNFVYRIYGIRGHPNKDSYTLLHGTDKDVNNDTEGKSVAKWRLQQLERGEARTHRFDLSGLADSSFGQKPGDES
jgi:hypothetical protein